MTTRPSLWERRAHLSSRRHSETLSGLVRAASHTVTGQLYHTQPPVCNATNRNVDREGSGKAAGRAQTMVTTCEGGP